MPLLPAGTVVILSTCSALFMFACSSFLHRNRAHGFASCTQVFFLDNVDIRYLSRNHNVIPRVKVFDQIYLKRMTEACASRGENDFSSFIGVSVYMAYQLRRIPLCVKVFVLNSLYFAFTRSVCGSCQHT